MEDMSVSCLFFPFFLFLFFLFPFGKGRPALSHVIRQMGLAGGLGSAANPLRVLRLVVLLQNPSGTALWRGPVPTGPTSVAGGKLVERGRNSAGTEGWGEKRGWRGVEGEIGSFFSLFFSCCWEKREEM